MRRHLALVVLGTSILATPASAGSRSWMGLDRPAVPRSAEASPDPRPMAAPRPVARSLAPVASTRHAPYDVLAFSPGGELSASLGFREEDIRLEEFPMAIRGWTLLGHRAAVRALAFGSSGNRLFSGDADGVVRVWDLGAWRRARRPTPTPTSRVVAELGSPVHHLAISPVGNDLAVLADSRGASRLVSVRTGQAVLLPGAARPRAAAFDRDGRHLALAEGNRVTILRVSPGLRVAQRNTHHTDERALSAIAFAGEEVLATDADGPVYAFRPGAPGTRRLPGRAGAAGALDVTGDGTRYAVAGARPGVVEVRSLADGTRITRHELLTPAFAALRFLPDDRSVACGGGVLRGVAGRWALSRGAAPAR